MPTPSVPLRGYWRISLLLGPKVSDVGMSHVRCRMYLSHDQTTRCHILTRLTQEAAVYDRRRSERLPSNFESRISNCTPNVDSSNRPIFKILTIGLIEQSVEWTIPHLRFSSKLAIRHWSSGSIASRY